MMRSNVAKQRLVPDRSFPAYAYVPGHYPHPVRHPLGHSSGSEPVDTANDVELELREFRWGIDLFNHGYYWEAHEAWEGLWKSARSRPNRMLFKGLILLAASGVKVRQGKTQAAQRHAARAAATLFVVGELADAELRQTIGTEIASLAALADSPALCPILSQSVAPVFPFVLG